MKKLLLWGIVGLFSTIALAQSVSSTKNEPLPKVNFHSNVGAPLTAQERGFIIEVYGENSEKYVFSNPNRMRDIKNILRNRVLVNEYPGKDLSPYPKLSTVPLLSAFNPNISRNTIKSATDFNPIKYQFNFYSRETETQYYLIDNTQLLISILPQHN